MKSTSASPRDQPRGHGDDCVEHQISQVIVGPAPLARGRHDPVQTFDNSILPARRVYDILTSGNPFQITPLVSDGAGNYSPGLAVPRQGQVGRARPRFRRALRGPVSLPGGSAPR